MLGASFLNIAGYFSRKKKLPTNLTESSANLDSESKSRDELEAIGIFVTDLKKTENSNHEYKNFLICSLFCACLVIGNIRFYQMWKARHSNNRFDADAFQRGFDRFMNEKAYENYKGL